MNSPYLAYKDYMREHYGEPLFRVPIDFNFGCPNREADGSGGCTFCNVRGSAAVQTIGAGTVKEQMHEAIRFARNRYNAKKYMAYIQAFSATFGKSQQPLYLDLLDSFDFTAVSIGTRPDCLTPQAYDFLVELNRHIEVWVELGVQTVHDRTLDRINRGHDWASSETSIRKLHDLGLNVAVHAILGLPGETAEDYRQTADTLAALPIDAVKIHNLHIEKGTTLALEHALTPLPVLMEYDFAEHLMDFIRRMPPNIPIMRLTTDTLDEELIAPKWHMAKGQFRDYVVQQMTCREWKQGDLFGNLKPETGNWNFEAVETKDGSTTFWNEEYKEHYHTPEGARLEAEEKYLVPGKLKERLAQGEVQLLDVCFGLGYNSLSALEFADSPHHSLKITALEMDRRVVGAAAQNIQTLETDSNDWKKILGDLYETQSAFGNQQSAIQIVWGDARYTVTHLPDTTFDLVFLDAFSTQRNSELWTVDFFRKLKRVMKPDGVLLTYCAAIPVRAGLLEAGFFVGETDPVGRARGGTCAALREDLIEIPLPAHEMRMIRETSRGLPYRDPYGVRTNKEILRDRQENIIKCKQEGTSNP
ncbi:TIGR01212 family radical SAM protein [Pontiella agarivorans]|uniref:TIGR01212 family radical SAM protein n=1 Tax=Pontiella agarivorans TaxID=3038953 RepID=A0ABU5N0J0_9BACT|nr:TIGR01212 family radical SAM protein [Pontiella agarivorans]MDZ8119967.1 TIGR01212 family radical SAM protein [Pontiella agarivorans]